MFGNWFSNKTIGDPVKQLPQIGELLNEVRQLKSLVSELKENERKGGEELFKLRSMFTSICPHKHTKLYDKGILKWEDHFLLTGQDIRTDQYIYGRKCDTCDHETTMTKLEYLRAQKELIESSIKESE